MWQAYFKLKIKSWACWGKQVEFGRRHDPIHNVPLSPAVMGWCSGYGGWMRWSSVNEIVCWRGWAFSSSLAHFSQIQFWMAFSLGSSCFFFITFSFFNLIPSFFTFIHLNNLIQIEAVGCHCWGGRIANTINLFLLLRKEGHYFFMGNPSFRLIKICNVHY